MSFRVRTIEDIRRVRENRTLDLQARHVPIRVVRHKRSGRAWRGYVRMLLGFQRQALAVFLAFMMLLIRADIFLAFEAHVVNVTAEIAMIDPPTITPPGGSYTGSVDISIDDSDLDATHIFYTVTPGLDPDSAPDPVCGDALGGLKPVGPVALTDDSVVKAIACDGDTGLAHGSLITTETYDISTNGMIEGHKYHDLDQSGTLTDGDIPIEGWEITLTYNTTTVETVTGDGGFYSFMDLAPGSYTVFEETRDGWENTTPTSTDVVLSTGETEAVDFFNFDTGFACVPKDIDFPADLAVQAAGATNANDDIALAANTTVNGDVRSNDEIEKVGGGSNRTINGDATVTNTIESGITVTGTTTTGAPTAALPDIMIEEWKARAQDGGTVNGSFIFSNGTTGLQLGPSEIMGDVEFGSSNTATLRGPLYIHGDLEIGSNSVITEDAAFGNQFIAIIVDGEIDIEANVAFNGSGASGAFLLVSTHAAISGTNSAIHTDSNNADLGDVVLYASNGDIHVESNRTILAAFAAHGTGTDSDDNAAIRFDSNVTVNYRTLPDKISCGPRQPYETTSHIVVNEFMPRPSGGETGSAGLPHDGEWVELFNPTGVSVDVTGWVLYDNDNAHALPITVARTDPANLTIPSGGFLVVYRDGDSDFNLNNSGGDSVRLFNGFIGSGGTLVDSHTYTVNAAVDKSFARIPDGSANWIDPPGTPGGPNLIFFEPLPGIDSAHAFDPAEKPLFIDDADHSAQPTPATPPSPEPYQPNGEDTSGDSAIEEHEVNPQASESPADETAHHEETPTVEQTPIELPQGEEPNSDAIPESPSSEVPPTPEPNGDVPQPTDEQSTLPSPTPEITNSEPHADSSSPDTAPPAEPEPPATVQDIPALPESPPDLPTA
ncbi:MAG: lamin tail domain-containing protein [Parcubacteria group bacterium]|nr:lamin tail domain-containing protein [Parcubacteria group bacterium]